MRELTKWEFFQHIFLQNRLPLHDELFLAFFQVEDLLHNEKVDADCVDEDGLRPLFHAISENKVNYLTVARFFPVKFVKFSVIFLLSCEMQIASL